MTYSLASIPRIDELLCDGENRKEIAKSLNLKHNTWKHTNGETYNILKYDKEWLNNESKASVGLLRSLIFKDSGEVVCFAPPKSLDPVVLSEKTDDDIIKDGYVFEEFVEGTMVNVFYDKSSSTWEIATRSNVGGTMCFFMENGFNVENTFKFMFDEVCNANGFDLNVLDNKYVYSFVMQHPRNRIVKPIVKMALYLVDVYHIEDNKIIHTVEMNGNVEQFGIVPNTVNLISRQPIRTAAELDGCKLAMASMNTPYDIVGVVIKNNFGERYKFRNPSYEHVRQLRGNQPKLQYQYLLLRQSGRVAEYLQYYKEHKRAFNDFRNVIHDYTNQLFSNYIRCYIKKEKKLTEFPEKYRTHMFTLHHERYLKELMPVKKYVNKVVVINYFNELHPSKQMFILNYDVRKSYMDSKKVDNPIELTSSSSGTINDTRDPHPDPDAHAHAHADNKGMEYMSLPPPPSPPHTPNSPDHDNV
jgi:hypothetical protein